MGIKRKLKKIFVLNKSSQNEEGLYPQQIKDRENSSVLKINLYEEMATREDSWDNLTQEEQKQLVEENYLVNWQDFIYNYNQNNEQEKIKIIEMLAYIPQKEAVDFLMKEMKSPIEIISLSASSSLKKQDKSLTLDPILDALTQPDQWLPSRVLEVLKEIGAGSIELILETIKTTDTEVQSVLVQVLGEMGDSRCLEVLTDLAESPDNTLRLRTVEALKNLKIEESFFILTKLVEDDQWQIRMHAVEALANLNSEETEEVLAKRLTLEDDPLVLEYLGENIEKIQEENTPDIISWVRER